MSVDPASLLTGFVVGVSFSFLIPKLLPKRNSQARILPPEGVDLGSSPGGVEAMEAALREIEEKSSRGKITVEEIAEILSARLPPDMDHDPVRINLERMRLKLKQKLEELRS